MRVLAFFALFAEFEGPAGEPTYRTAGTWALIAVCTFPIMVLVSYLI
ncbi:MAG TPA: hypothetical protein VM938_07210 [Acidimicrobiales bacterium]|nr:hypothetical protein [Acidimicrobiales bacterium]